MPLKRSVEEKRLNIMLHALPGYMRAVIMELRNKKLSREEIAESLSHIVSMTVLNGNKRTGRSKFKEMTDSGIEIALKLGIIEENKGSYYLTGDGEKVAGFMHVNIFIFFRRFFSIETSIKISVFVLIILGILKLGFGFVSGSAGLIADGIDNTMDILSSLIVWAGLKLKKEKASSVFIIAMMFISIIFLVITGIGKIIDPKPISEGMLTIAVSLIAGLTMMMLSLYQDAAGKKNGNFTVICQSVESKNHFYISIMVSLGILLSIVSKSLKFDWLIYSDGAVSIIITLLIFRAALSLTLSFLKGGENEGQVADYLKGKTRSFKRRFLYNWIMQQLADEGLTANELVSRFKDEFCRTPPAILSLTGFGYMPEDARDLEIHLDKFIKEKKIKLEGGKYYR